MELIKNIGYNQYEIIQNILKLYNNSQPIECDITYSVGQFYKKKKKKTHLRMIVEKQ